jgi:hypothetical protein
MAAASDRERGSRLDCGGPLYNNGVMAQPGLCGPAGPVRSVEGPVALPDMLT